MMMSPVFKEEVGRQKSDVDSSRPDDVVQNDKATSFSVLPQDCLDKMLSFLTLRECLTIGSTSLTFMVEIRSDLKRRRNKMTQSFAYTGTWLSYDTPAQSYTLYRHKLVHANGESTEDTLLPTVRDRVESLCLALPRSHPSSAMARELLDEINRDDIGLQVNSETFQDALDMNTNLVRSHRLHANLLSQAIYANPYTPDPNSLTVTLEQFMSDVLCAYYLMGHSVAGIAEGGPTEAEWMDVVLSYPWLDSDSDLLVDSNLSEERCEIASVNHCYRGWIFLHSTFLRLAPFTREQQVRLGLVSALPFGSTFDTGILEPYRPFCGHEFARRWFEVKFHINQYWVEMRITLSDFGRLGPTFLGRDSIQSYTDSPLSFWKGVFTFLSTKPEEYSCPRTDSQRSWIGGENAQVMFTRLLLMQEEANKVRPMMVSPPVVSLDLYTRLGVRDTHPHPHVISVTVRSHLQ